MKHCIVASLLAGLLAAIPAFARIIRVPDNHQTIQGALDACRARDTILVAPGVYDENLVAPNRNFVLGSFVMTTGDRAYMDSTIIDGGGRSQVMYWPQSNISSEMRGFTIRNGFNNQGIGAAFLIGVWNRLLLQDNLIIENNERGFGGVIGAVQGNITMKRCAVTRNRTVADGNVVLAYNTLFNLQDCQIYDNDADLCGFFLGNCQLSMTRVMMAGNLAGIQIYEQGVWSDNSSYEFDHVTIVVPDIGGDVVARAMAITSQEDMTVEFMLTNSIISTPYPDNVGIDLIRTMRSQFNGLIEYNDLVGGRGLVGVTGDPNITWGEGIINEDPRYSGPEFWNYHLLADSPCIDAGNPDAAGDPDGTRSDLGAFFFDQNNHPAVVSPLGNLYLSEDCGRLEVADLDTIFSDADGDTLEYGFRALTALGFDIENGHLLTIAPAQNFYCDSVPVVVTVADPYAYDELTFYVRIDPVNDLPAPFNLVSPNDSSTVQYDAETRFDWERSSDPDSGASIRYAFHLVSPDLPDSSLLLVGDADTLRLKIGWDRPESSIVCEWWVEAISGEDTTLCTKRFSLTVEGSSSADVDMNNPTEFALFPAYPNPFNNSTTIRFSVGLESHPTRLAVFGADGRMVVELWRGERPMNRAEQVTWNAEGLPGGVYLVKLEAGGEIRTMKAVLLR